MEDERKKLIQDYRKKVKEHLETSAK